MRTSLEDVPPPDEDRPIRASTLREAQGPTDAAPRTEVRQPRTVALTILAVLGVVAALRFAQVILIPFVLGVLISYALDPIVSSLARARVPRAVGATVVVVALFVGIVAGGYALRGDATALVEQLPVVARRIGRLVESHTGNSSIGKVQQAAREIEKAATAATQPPPPAPRGAVPTVQVQEPAVKIRDYLLTGSIGAVGVAAQVIVVLFLSLYLLASGDMFRRKLVHVVGPSFSTKKVTVEILEEIDRQIAAFLLVRATISIVVALATWVALALVGLNHPALWGVAAGLLNMIPYVGPTCIAVAAAVAGFMQFDTVGMAALTTGATVVVAMLEGYLLTPWLTSRAGKMNAVAVFVGLLFFGWLWGVWGLLLAVPMLMAVKAVCDRIEEFRVVSELLGE